MPVKVDLIVESVRNLFVVASWSNTNLNAADADGVFKHFSANFYLIRMLVLIDLDDGELSLCDKENDGNSGLISSETDTDVSVIGVEQELPFLVHFKEEIAGLHEEFFLVGLGDLHILLIVGYDFTCLEI